MLSRKDNDLHSVLESPLGRAINGRLSLLDFRAFQDRRIHEGLGRCLGSRSLDLCGLNFAEHSHNLLLGRSGDSFFLRTAVDDYHVLLARDHLGDHLAQDGSVDLAEEIFRQVIFSLRLHVGLVVEEIAYKRMHELRILTGRCLIDSFFQRREDIILGPGDLSVREPVLTHLLKFGKEGLESSEDVVFLECHLAHDRLECLTEPPGGEHTGKIRSVSLRGNISETLGHHGSDNVLNQID